MTVEVHMKTQTTPVVRENIISTFIQDGMFCVFTREVTEKYPMVNIFRVVEKA